MGRGREWAPGEASLLGRGVCRDDPEPDRRYGPDIV
jgi:hypothetical protein